MNQTPPQPIDPFRHFNPDLWTASRKAHITLFSIGTLLVIPAVYALFMMVMMLTTGFGFGRPDIDTQAFFAIASVAASTSTGTLAWSALGILFFKRADARWQRVCWNTCTVYGLVGTICYIGWFIFVIQQPSITIDASWPALFAIGIFLLTFGSALACTNSGRSYASAAKKHLQGLNTGANP